LKERISAYPSAGRVGASHRRHEGHPSAAQLYERIKVQFPTMSQATVYKTLALLKEMNQVLEMITG